MGAFIQIRLAIAGRPYIRGDYTRDFTAVCIEPLRSITISLDFDIIQHRHWNFFVGKDVVHRKATADDGVKLVLLMLYLISCKWYRIVPVYVS